MKKMNERVIFKHYIKERVALVIVFILIILTFFAVAGLYGYDKSIENMSYAALLVMFFGICGCIFDYVKYRRRCLRLYDALSRNGESDHHLPAPKGLVEEIYYEMVCRTENDKRRLLSELDEKRADMADYYTMWIHQIKTPIAALRLIQQRMGEEMDGMKTTTAVEAEEAAGHTFAQDRKQSSEELFKIEQYAEMALHYARLDSMSSDMLFKQYDISVIVKQAVKKYSLLFIGSGLSFSLEEFNCYAITDEKWLGFVVEQIISNALKYTTNGCVSIYGADKEGGMCSGNVSYFVIEDTGMGIRETDLPRIFERGFTGYNGRMGRKSTGIGLYLCREIMDNLSHTIRVKSVVGEGTKVIPGFEQE